MLKAIYNGEEGEVIAEYNQDGIDYVTMIFPDREQNYIKKSEIVIKN